MGEIIYGVDPEHRDVAKFKSSIAYKKILHYITDIDKRIQKKEILGDGERRYDLAESRRREHRRKDGEESEVPSQDDTRESEGNVFLSKIEEIIEEVPLEEGNQRYGNKGFINFVERLSIEGERIMKESFPGITDKDLSILQNYLDESFGNRSRIDYGTGHELNFFCFLIILMMRKLLAEDAVLLVLEHYFSIVRLLILKYKLEPAGSHGMGGLDDYQLLPFLFGSSQFCCREGFVFSDLFTEEERGLCYSKALRFIHIDKSFPPSKYSYKERIEKYNTIEITEEPFSHHSVTIYSLRTVPFMKINRGMIKMYDGVVLSTHAVIQHFISSEYLPI
ncbi:serine/threonine-protein phosphatase 2A activator [Nematocida minor]|uniref:serine/threonine-protein phosphatase 2A activator n=1 Tax=Nematocida minor TaxID=1912983 RepID=UPI00221F3796|nr:serine/threonine-protein phosphatase 2A activator [Nematocida minor]KAI5189451.1 serine/threonine-protein phosphatase 2A activator [Nematocida minor]